MDEKSLQRAIMVAVNSIMDSKENINGRIMDAAWEKLDGFPDFTITLGDISRRMGELEADFDILLHQPDSTGKDAGRFKKIANEMVKVISTDRIRVYLNDGTEIDQAVSP